MANTYLIPAGTSTNVLVVALLTDPDEVETHLTPVVAWEMNEAEDYIEGWKAPAGEYHHYEFLVLPDGQFLGPKGHDWSVYATKDAAIEWVKQLDEKRSAK